MSKTTEAGYFLLADISGFTAYQKSVELSHAREILAELLKLLVDHLSPLLTVSTLEGDAVFAYAPAEQLSRGETLLELIEMTYAAFKAHLHNSWRQTTCTCQACRQLLRLDLKFLVHLGPYVVYPAAGTAHVGGLDSTLVRERQLKEGVQAMVDWHGYALLTGVALAQMGLEPADFQHIQTQTYDHLGEIDTYGLDLEARYHERRNAQRIVVEPEEAHATLTFDMPASPPVVWEWLNDPEKRLHWMPGRNWKAALRLTGRTGIGASNHCAHRLVTIVETVVDWQPFHYYTVELKPFDRLFTLRRSYRLEPLSDGSGTRLHCLSQFQPLPAPLARALGRWEMARILCPDLERMRQLLARVGEGKERRRNEAPAIEARTSG